MSSQCGHQPALPLAQYRLHFLPDSAFETRGFLGSAWRGALGHALKRTVCVIRGTRCEACLLFRSCVFPQLFETPPPQDTGLMRKYQTVPHPYVLQLPFPGIGRQDEEHSITLGLVLIGRSHKQLPYLLHALKQAGLDGVGPKRTSLKLTHVEQSNSPSDTEWKLVYRPGEELIDHGLFLPEPPLNKKGRITIQLLSPFRTKVGGHLLRPEQFTFAAFFSPLMRRIGMLQSFFTDTSPSVDFRTLTELAKRAEIEQTQLEWREWSRFSHRQQSRMQMGGITGEFTLSMDQMEPFHHWLWIGQWTHNGKAATMGMGRYRIVYKKETTSYD